MPENPTSYRDARPESDLFNKASSSIGLTSVGVMEEDEYTFSSAQPEEMTVITGALKVLLPGAPDWQVFMPGEKFFVPGHSEFNLQVADVTAYLCRYLSK